MLILPTATRSNEVSCYLAPAMIGIGILRIQGLLSVTDLEHFQEESQNIHDGTIKYFNVISNYYINYM